MKTSVNLAGVELKNPVMTASGTFGSGAEYSEFVDLKELGAVVTKVLRMCRGRESDAAYCGGLRRNAECDRTAESWY